MNPNDEPARPAQERGAAATQGKPRTIAARSGAAASCTGAVRREPVGKRSDERCPSSSPTRRRADIHAARFPDGQPDPSRSLEPSRCLPPPGGCPSLVLGAHALAIRQLLSDRPAAAPVRWGRTATSGDQIRRRQLSSTFAWALSPRCARARREPPHGRVPRDARPRRRRRSSCARSSPPRSASSSTGASNSAHSEALRDPLTGLPNRALLDDRIEQAFRRSRRSGEPFTLIAIDLDGFKDVNDVRGHRAGDLVLKALARRFEAIVRRIGHGRAGRRRRVRHPLDRDTASDERAAALVGRLRHALRRPFRVEGAAVEIDGSIGWAVFPDDGATADELLSRADGQMYATKRDTSDENVLLRRGVDAGVVRDVEARSGEERAARRRISRSSSSRRACRGRRKPSSAACCPTARSCRPPSSSRTSSARRSSAS